MSGPLLCVTVTGRTTEELRARRDAVGEADLVELRLDGVEDLSVAGALAGRRSRVIVTCRPRWEGGVFDGSEDERRAILADAGARGAEYVDLEWRAGFDDLLQARGGKGIVLSMHDLEGVPADLRERFRAMRATGAEVVKLAVRARRLADCLPLREIGRRGSRYAPTVVVGLGPAGLATRVLAAHFGSFWTYAGEFAELGQIDPLRLGREFRFRRISPATDVYGVVGRPIAHSVSPAMHNAAFRSASIDAVHLPLAAADVDDFIEFATALHVKGASITAPFKVELFERVDEADSVSRRVGAVNTIKVRDGRWLGTNTDVPGFLGPLERRMTLGDVRAAVLGAGGAARAVVVGLASAGAKVTVYARDVRRAADVAMLAGGAGALPPPAAGSWDLLVHATPVGTFPNVTDTPLPDGPFDGRLVYDLVYNPAPTRLLADAANAGCQTLNGLEMLVAQAQLQAEWWTGHRPGERLMREAALERLEEFSLA